MITAHRKKSLEPTGVESICLDVKGCGNSWFLVCACYRSPNKCKVSDFIPSCSSAAEQIYAKRKKEIVFIGDFNMNMLPENSNLQGDSPNPDLTSFCDQFSLTMAIDEPARVTKTSRTLLDVVLISNPEQFGSSSNLHIGISDHDLVYIVKKQKLPKP